MLKHIVFIAFSLLFGSRPLYAQKLLGFVGIGLGYDAFLPDKAEQPYHSKWPFAPGAESMFGLKYLPEDGFEVFFNATLGTVNIQVPAPGYKRSGTYLEQFHSHITLGSGPQLKTERCGSLIPYVHLGAGFFSDWGETSNNTDANIVTQKVNSVTSDTWALMCGAGLDWQFGDRHLSGLNLQLSYTPMDIYAAPPQYLVSTPSGVTNIKLQGRLLQCMLTYNAHFNIKKWYKS